MYPPVGREPLMAKTESNCADRSTEDTTTSLHRTGLHRLPCPRSSSLLLCVLEGRMAAARELLKASGPLWNSLSDAVRTQAVLPGTSLSACCSFRRAVPTCHGTPGAPFGEPQVLAVPTVVGWASPLVPAEGTPVPPAPSVHRSDTPSGLAGTSSSPLSPSLAHAARLVLGERWHRIRAR